MYYSDSINNGCRIWFAIGLIALFSFIYLYS